MTYSKKNNYLLLVLFIILGIVVGAIITRILAEFMQPVPFVTQSVPLFRLPSATLNLEILSMTFGMNLKINLIVIVCTIISLLIYRKY